MKLKIKRKLLGCILSDGSFRFTYESDVLFKTTRHLDIVNHFVWTGKGPKEQTEVANFVVRLNKELSVR
uniref:Ribosomal protein L31 n=1 Tax=Coccophora langsdorfii TaxID=74099 RepID=A0A1L2F1L9_9PHAE|nr:ribosomal protein L31 [Coccophora langsdorfii]ANS72211.1 ribosomal protein L31 [Coccophora langsdorfii]